MSLKQEMACTNRRGLTLLELIVVLVILVAVAGVLVPLLPNFLQRAHTSTSAGNISDIVRQVQTHDAMFNGHPNNLDPLVTGAAVDGDSIFADTTNLTAAVATTDQLDSLQAIGITTVEPMSATPANATFEPYVNATTTPVALTTSTKVLSLTTVAEQALNLPIANDYVAFGLGARNTGVGKSMTDAPLHFPEAGGNPAVSYCRFLLVYQIPLGGAPARLAAVVAVHDDGAEIAGLAGHLSEYFETLSNGS